MTLGFGRKGHSTGNGQQDASAVLKELNAQLSPQLKQALIDTEAIIRPEDEPHVQSVLRRFLVAEKLDVNTALRRMEKHVHWRQQVVPQAIQETEIIDQINQKKVLLQPKGPDGRPLLIIRVARHFATTTVECETFVTFCLEAASRLCDALPTGDGKLWALFDLDGVKWSNMDRHALASCFSILEKEFPERVGKIFMLNSPFIFDALYRIVSAFIDPHTREKVGFISELDPFLRVVDKSIIPQVYGGLANEIPIEIAVRRMKAQNSSENGYISCDEEVEKAANEAKEGPSVVVVGA